MSQNTPAGAIDPNTFTPDELLKHTYRLVKEMNEKMDEQKKEFAIDKVENNNKIEKLQSKVAVLETRIEEKEKSFKQVMAIATICLTILSLALSFVVYFLK